MSASTAQASALRRLTLVELKLFLRERVGPVWGIGFPILLLVIFGCIPTFKRPSDDLGGLTPLDVYVPILVAFVIAIISLNALPAVLAGYREKGILRRLSTTPIGPARVLAAQLAINFATAGLTVVLILVVARYGFAVAMPAKLIGFVISALLGAVALLAFGLLLAALLPSARAAQATGTILFFPMMFFAGLWLPISQMPRVLRHISRATPLGATVQALQDSAQGQWPGPLQLLALAGYALVFSLLAARFFRWE